MNSFYFLIFLGLCSSSLSISENPSSESILYIRLGEEMFSVNLYDSPIRRELISLLPLQSNPINKKEFIHFPLTLEIEEDIEIEIENSAVGGNSVIELEKGDVVLFQKKELIVINKKIILDNNNEYIKLGKTEFTDELYNAIKFNKPVYLWNSFDYINYNENIKPHEHYINIMNFITYKIVTVICYLYL